MMQRPFVFGAFVWKVFFIHDDEHLFYGHTSTNGTPFNPAPKEIYAPECSHPSYERIV